MPESQESAAQGASIPAIDAAASASAINETHVTVNVIVPQTQAAPTHRKSGGQVAKPAHRNIQHNNVKNDTRPKNSGINRLYGETDGVATIASVPPVHESTDVVFGNKVTTITDEKNGKLIIKQDKTTGTFELTLRDTNVELNTSTRHPGFTGYRNEPYEYGFEKRAFGVSEGDQKSWFNKPQIHCADTPGWDTKNTSNKQVNIATAAEVRNYMDAHPALAAYVKAKGQDLTFKDGHSVNLKEIEQGLKPNIKLEVCPANKDSFMEITPRNTGNSHNVIGSSLKTALGAAKS